jgi:hypothetical protein
MSDCSDRLLTAAEAANLLASLLPGGPFNSAADGDRQPARRVYRMARQGVLPHVRLGRLVYFRANALRSFVEEGGRALPGGWRMKAPERGTTHA